MPRTTPVAPRRRVLTRLNMAFSAMLVMHAVQVGELLYWWDVYVEFLTGQPYFQVFLDAMPLLMSCIGQAMVIMFGVVCLLRWVHRRTPRFRLIVWGWVGGEATLLSLLTIWAVDVGHYVPGIFSSILQVPVMFLLVDEMLLLRRVDRKLSHVQARP